MKSTYSSLVILLFTFLTIIPGTVRAQTTKTASDCTPGFLFCEYFGCLQLPSCPRVCETIADEATCLVSYDGISCKFDNGVCSRDVQCSGQGNSCSSDCMSCSTFGCIPKSSQCPRACPLYPSQDQCTKAPKYGSQSCQWSDNRCNPFDENNPNSLRPKPKSNNSEPSSEDTDFGTTLTKRSWASTVGIIVGVLFGFLGLLGIGLLLWHRARERKRKEMNEAVLDQTQPNRYRPYAFLQSLRSVVDRNAKELEAVPPLSPLPPSQTL